MSEPAAERRSNVRLSAATGCTYRPLRGSDSGHVRVLTGARVLCRGLHNTAVGRAGLSRLRYQVEVGVVGGRASPHRFRTSLPERTAVEVVTIPALRQVGSVVRKRQPTSGLVAAPISSRDDRHRVDRNFHSRIMAPLIRRFPLTPLRQDSMTFHSCCAPRAQPPASYRRECHITQLEFDGFTNKQAVHGVDSVGR